MTSSRTNPAPSTGEPSCRQLFAEWSLLRRAWEGIGCALLAGAVTGIALGTSWWLYYATAAIASVAGIPAATQHRTLRGALLRTTVGGFAWAAAVLGVHLALGHPAVVRVPDPLGWYLVLATLPATGVGWAVWTWSARARTSPVPRPRLRLRLRLRLSSW